MNYFRELLPLYKNEFSVLYKDCIQPIKRGSCKSQFLTVLVKYHLLRGRVIIQQCLVTRAILHQYCPSFELRKNIMKNFYRLGLRQQRCREHSKKQQDRILRVHSRYLFSKLTNAMIRVSPSQWLHRYARKHRKDRRYFFRIKIINITRWIRSVYEIFR